MSKKMYKVMNLLREERRERDSKKKLFGISHVQKMYKVMNLLREERREREREKGGHQLLTLILNL
jgi:hypothetical protein